MCKDDLCRILELVDLMLDAIKVIKGRTSHITSGDDFLISADNMFILDGVCMKLIFIGESVKTIDKMSGKELLPLYPEIPWHEIMKLRDLIAHHYFRIDSDMIYMTIKYDLNPLSSTLQDIKYDLLASLADYEKQK